MDLLKRLHSARRKLRPVQALLAMLQINGNGDLTNLLANGTKRQGCAIDKGQLAIKEDDKT